MGGRGDEALWLLLAWQAGEMPLGTQRQFRCLLWSGGDSSFPPLKPDWQQEGQASSSLGTQSQIAFAAGLARRCPPHLEFGCHDPSVISPGVLKQQQNTLHWPLLGKSSQTVQSVTKQSQCLLGTVYFTVQSVCTLHTCTVLRGALQKGRECPETLHGPSPQSSSHG